MVAFGEYANAKSHEAWEMMTPKQRAKEHKTWLDQWAVMFVPLEDALALNREKEEADVLSLETAASILFG